MSTTMSRVLPRLKLRLDLPVALGDELERLRFLLKRLRLRHAAHREIEQELVHVELLAASPHLSSALSRAFARGSPLRSST